MAIGAIQFGVMYLAYIYCFTTLKAYQAAIFTIITPIYVVLFDSILRKRFSLVYLIAALLSVIGALVIKYEGVSKENLIAGFLTMQIANIAFAFGQVCYALWKEKHQDIPNKDIFASLYLGAFLLTGIICLSYTDFHATVSSLNISNVSALIYLGIIASGIGFFFWNIGASQSKNPGTLAVFNNMLPPAAALVSIVFFGEYKTLSSDGIIRLILGTLIIFASLFINYSKTPKLTHQDPS